VNAPDILTAAHRAGIRLSLADNGKLKFAGRQAALDRLLPEIRAHKAAVLLALAARDSTLDRHRRFTVIRADGAVLSVSRCPPCPLADVQADYPEGVCSVERVPETAVALAPADLALAQAVLHAWGEDDPVMIAEWMDGLVRDPGRLRQMRVQAVALGLASRDG
jgi:hypothetical protein